MGDVLPIYIDFICTFEAKCFGETLEIPLIPRGEILHQIDGCRRQRLLAPAPVRYDDAALVMHHLCECGLLQVHHLWLIAYVDHANTFVKIVERRFSTFIGSDCAHTY